MVTKRRMRSSALRIPSIPYTFESITELINEDSENVNGGELFINLGNISEDVMRDSRKAFENGLPKDLDDLAATTAETDWGIVPTTQSVVNAS